MTKPKFENIFQDSIDSRLAKAKREGEESLILKLPEHKDCDHGVVFDEKDFKDNDLSASEVRKKYPRGWGPCPKGCGFNGIAYASFLHYIAGDW